VRRDLHHARAGGRAGPGGSGTRQLLFAIAEKVGGTVEELSQRLSLSEFYGWAEWFKLKAERTERATKGKTSKPGKIGRRR
jgi:hypothetical protein